MGKGTPKTLEKIGKVDVLICEHTTLSRQDENFMSEFMLQEEAVSLIKSKK